MESSIWVVVHYDPDGERAGRHEEDRDIIFAYQDGWIVDYVGPKLTDARAAYLEFNEANNGAVEFYLGKLDLMNRRKSND